MATIQIEESEHANLIAQSSRTTALEAEITAANTRAEAAEAALATAANDRAAEAIVAEAFTAAGITAPKTAARLSRGYAVKEGALDADALKADIEESIKELAEAAGLGKVHGNGPSGVVAETIATEADVLKALGRTVKGA